MCLRLSKIQQIGKLFNYQENCICLINIRKLKFHLNTFSDTDLIIHGVCYMNFQQIQLTLYQFACKGTKSIFHIFLWYFSFIDRLYLWILETSHKLQTITFIAFETQSFYCPKIPLFNNVLSTFKFNYVHWKLFSCEIFIQNLTSGN